MIAIMMVALALAQNYLVRGTLNSPREARSFQDRGLRGDVLTLGGRSAAKLLLGSLPLLSSLLAQPVSFGALHRGVVVRAR